MAYDKGDLVVCSAEFTDPSDALVDPATVTFKIKTPAAATTTYVYGTDAALVKDAVGRYHVNVNANAVGTWHYRFESTGSYQAADEQQFVVEPTDF